MANVYATKSGNWSDTTVWNTLALPTVNDDVWSNNFLVYVDSNFRVISVRNKATTGINAGGGFILNNGVSLSANVEGSGVTGSTNACVRFLSAAPSFATIVGNISANNTAITAPIAVYHNGTGTLNIFGNGLGGINNNTDASTGYIDNNSTGTINISGNIIGGSNTTIFGIDNNSTGTINITGNVFAGTQSTGIFVSVGGNVNITGNLIGQNGRIALNNSGNGNIFILGNVLASTGLGVINSSRGTATVYGYVSGGLFGGSGSNNRSGIENSGTLFLSGDAYGTGFNNDNYGVYNLNTGVLFMTGNCFGGNPASGDRPYGVRHAAFAGSATIYGNAYGGARNSGHGIGVTNGASIEVFGNVFGGTGAPSYGIFIDVDSGAIVNGDAYGGTGLNSSGAFNNATGFLYLKGIAVGNGWGLGSAGINSAPGIIGSQTGTTIVQGLCCGPRGQWPTGGNIFVLPQQNSTMTFETSAFQDVTLFTSLSANITPPVSSVRLGTRYNLNDYTGTCAIPSISSVLQGVAVDNSTGIAALQPQTVWSVQTSAIDTNSLGGRLKESATVQSFGQLLTAFNI
jgi:hypothetical protein